MQRAQIHFSALQSSLLIFILFPRCFFLASKVSSFPKPACIYFDYAHLRRACHRGTVGKMIRGNERFMSRSARSFFIRREFFPQWERMDFLCKLKTCCYGVVLRELTNSACWAMQNLSAYKKGAC